MKKTYMEKLYKMILDYANQTEELIPKFKVDCKDIRSIKKCPNYKEVHAICEALNAIAPYAEKESVIPSKFVEREHGRK